jgi:hypothetical protein
LHTAEPRLDRQPEEEDAMGQPKPPRKHPLTWIAISVLLLAAVVGTLWVPFYVRLTPKLGAFPFFYWYQLMWVPIVAFLSWIAYLLIGSGRRAAPGASATTAATPVTGTGQARGDPGSEEEK